MTLKTLHINTNAALGGAGRAMYRLHQGLQRLGHDSRILAVARPFVEPGIVTTSELVKGHLASPATMIDTLGRRLEAHLGIPFSRYQSTKYTLRSELFQRADVVNLHNLHGRYFNYHLLPTMSRRKPIIWTLHDMWAMTGHCAYAYSCHRWRTGCFDCPLLKEPGRQIVEPPPTPLDCTRTTWRTKRKLYQQSRLHIVTPSRWLLGLVEQSILADAMSVQCIPNGVDLAVFRPLDREMARRALDVPSSARTILFVSQSVTQGRKGFHYLLDALDRIEDPEGMVLLTIGTGGLVGKQLERFRRRDLGPLSDEGLMSLVYSAADLFVFPTLADNQPLVLIEALACGTPIVSFDVGGVPEMVRHMETGYLASYRDAEDIARGIRFLLMNDDLRKQMSRRCREVAEAEYSVELQAQRYVELYERAIEGHLSASH